MLPSIFFIYTLTLGYAIEPIDLMIANHVESYPPYSTGLSAGFSIGDPSKTHLEITGSATTWEDMRSITVFAPAIAHYGFKVAFVSSFLTLSVSHLCIHPVLAYPQRSTYVFGGHTTAAIQFRAAQKLF